ncbi:flagellar basal body-associated FliL family protein [Roseovarius pelagicus]|uniref:Flagellar protein FliL n=1 Tax=Roseovarius pelagicus TaxID=2980108 RepID=A0ABY6D817_9RHOB|nr:flagellar basal body-associated FliL family protein [Roseovarius pelagicus]UXX82281.1 flagellar basal body-associated FliL family protein [Roseovarius pelagicus]
MMKKLLPIILLLIGIGGGVGAGLALRPAQIPGETDDTENMTTEEHPEQKSPTDDGHVDTDHANTDGVAFVRLNNQFVIPVVSPDRVEALVVMSLSIELAKNQPEAVYEREPKLRDKFLQVLFEHANMGGFDGEFTDAKRLDTLRASLLEVAQHVVGAEVTSVLITDIARQDR